MAGSRSCDCKEMSNGELLRFLEDCCIRGPGGAIRAWPMRAQGALSCPAHKGPRRPTRLPASKGPSGPSLAHKGPGSHKGLACKGPGGPMNCLRGLGYLWRRFEAKRGPAEQSDAFVG